MTHLPGRAKRVSCLWPANKTRDELQRMRSSPASHDITNLLVVSDRSTAPVMTSRFSLTAVRVLLWKVPLAVHCRPGRVIFCSMDRSLPAWVDVVTANKTPNLARTYL